MKCLIISVTLNFTMGNNLRTENNIVEKIKFSKMFLLKVKTNTGK